MLVNKHSLITFTLCCLFTGAANAVKKPEDLTKAPINIYADYMKYELQSGVSTYQGDVRVTQSTMELTGDKVIAVQKDKVLKNIKVTGSPATYRQLAEDGNYINAQSMQMEYQADKNRLVLSNKARLEQAGSVMESDQIIYDTVNEVVIAGDDKTNKRVNITITPEDIKKQ
ncbi:MAG: lipopolysaccharide transport periplasmic protein LptA [Thiotrichales bacterium]|nr:MAG: lipopolysaccharide transport periplasmic protein LptA [Thiotrichales bacterium]